MGHVHVVRYQITEFSQPVKEFSISPRTLQIVCLQLLYLTLLTLTSLSVCKLSLHNSHKISCLNIENKVCARLAQLVRSLTAKQKVPVQSPAWSKVELWAAFLRHTIRGQGC